MSQAIGDLKALKAGETDPRDPLHTASKLTSINLRRIRASKPGGTWRDWPKDLRAPCHKRASGKTYPGVYAQDVLGQTISDYDDAVPMATVTVDLVILNKTELYRYAKRLYCKHSPRTYEFLHRDEEVSFKEVGRWIGNAVPVKLAEAIGRAIIKAHEAII